MQPGRHRDDRAAGAQYVCRTEFTESRSSGAYDVPLIFEIVQSYRSDRVITPQSLLPQRLVFEPLLWSGSRPRSS